jgi:chromate reductase, NAD(P)H dehydrogenase (quinone)
VPGVLKNAIDWLSRPPADIPRVFGGRPVAIMGASNGPGGTALSQAAWLPVMRRLGMRPWFEGGVLIAEAFMVFDSDGYVADDSTRQRIQRFVEGFVTFASDQRRQVARVGVPLLPQVNAPPPDLSTPPERAAMPIVAKGTL